MITYELIQLAKQYKVMDELVHDYYAHTQAADNVPPLDIDWLTYLQLEIGEQILAVGAFENERMVGFVMYVISKNLHHKQITIASCDILGVRHTHRNQRVGRHLMAAAELRMRDLNVHYITHQFRVDYEVEPLFGKLGYELLERTYRKRIA